MNCFEFCLHYQWRESHLRFYKKQTIKRLSVNITELLVTQKNVDQISAEFGLTEEQTLEAMAAVIPAFSEGLKRQIRTPEGAANFISALSSGQHAQYTADLTTAMNETGIKEGNAILGHLFGTKKVSRAVAKQAAAETGISPSMFKSLLPVMASLVMGSIFKGATTSQAASADGEIGDVMSGAVGGGLLGQILSGLAEGLLDGAKKSAQPRRRVPSRRRTSSQPGTLQEILEQALNGGSTSNRQRKPQARKKTNARKRRHSTRSSGGLGGIFDDLLGTGQTKSRNRRKTQAPQPQYRRRSRQTTGGLDEIFGDFLEPGGKSRESQRRATESIFDEFLKG